ncbi:MAG: DegT/DnrJ/EryC1/StrS aminotransferase family protein [Pseudomonadota bacterium]
MLNTPFTPWPSYTQEEADAVSAVLLSNKVNYWTGIHVREFEQEFATFTQSKYAIAVANGTVALELALRALNIGEGDEVVVTSRTFIATVSSIVMVGATPVFADVDEFSQDISAQTIAAVLSQRTKAVICVHLAGMPCDMDPIMALAKSNNIYVIEDCAQAHGALYKGKSVGSIGDIGSWSFCQDKIMTTAGEGGMVTTNNKVLFHSMWSYKDHGKTKDIVKADDNPHAFRWLHNSFGTNWRMTEIQAVIGRIQIKKMPNWHQLRRKNANAIIDTVEKFPELLSITRPPSYIEHAWYKCYLFVKPQNFSKGWSRDGILEKINSLGVPCYSGSCSEVYLEKAFDNTDWRPKKNLPIAQKLGKTSLMFLVHPSLSQQEIKKTCNVLSTVLKQASK